MFFTHEAEVLVVGAGPVGLMAALMLAERGVSVEVIDEEVSTESHNYALTLHSHVLKLLDEVGLTRDLLDLGVRVDKVAFYDRGGPRARLDLAKLEGPFPFLLVLPRMALENVIEKRLRSRKVPVHWSQRLSAIADAGEHVDCTVEKLGGDPGGYAVQTTMQVVEKVRHLKPRYVVGADGFFSIVRRRLGIPVERAGEARGYAPTEFRTDFDLHGEMRVMLDDDATSLLFPLPSGRCRFTVELGGAEIPPADSPYIPLGTRLHPRMPAEEFEASLRARCPWYESATTQVTWAGRVRFEPALAGRFGVGRSWLVGDAAHVTGPVGVQSMNEGLREAHDLASRIARILKDGAPASLLEEYHAERTALWRPLLGLAPGLEATAATDPWVKSKLDRLVSCLPACGPDLPLLANQLSLRLAQP